MTFEQMENNKLKITLNTKDLSAKGLDLNDFMAKPFDVFVSLLKNNKEKYNLIFKNSNPKIDFFAVEPDIILALANNINFPKIKQDKIVSNNISNFPLYMFSSIEDFSNFCFSIDNKSFIQNSNFFYYKNNYYIFFNFELKNQFKLNIKEFATELKNASFFTNKLFECGNIIW